MTKKKKKITEFNVSLPVSVLVITDKHKEKGSIICHTHYCPDCGKRCYKLFYYLGQIEKILYCDHCDRAFKYKSVWVNNWKVRCEFRNKINEVIEKVNKI